MTTVELIQDKEFLKFYIKHNVFTYIDGEKWFDNVELIYVCYKLI